MNDISPAPQVKEIAMRIVVYLKDNYQDRHRDDLFWFDMWWEKLFLLRAHAWWHYMVFCRNFFDPKKEFVGVIPKRDFHLPGEDMLNEAMISSNKADLSAEGGSASNDESPTKRVGGD